MQYAKFHDDRYMITKRKWHLGNISRHSMGKVQVPIGAIWGIVGVKLGQKAQYGYSMAWVFMVSLNVSMFKQTYTKSFTVIH